MNFGPIKLLVNQVMIPFLTFCYEHVCANYGIAIILLTIAIKVCFIPLMRKQYESMKAMQVLNPKIKSIRDKYQKQPEKLQKEMMALYKAHKINPLQGCLPMIIQIPFFLAIYATIMSDTFVNIISQPGINPGFLPFWLSNLANPDATFILPILLAGFTYWSQKLIMVDPQQQKLLLFSPVLILVFGLKLPAGVLLYWAVSTIFSTVQQLMIMKETGAPVTKVATTS